MVLSTVPAGEVNVEGAGETLAEVVGGADARRQGAPGCHLATARIASQAPAQASGCRCPRTRSSGFATAPA
jgi:hypothetical protein